MKMTISTSVWGAQHSNAGQNIQQLFSSESQQTEHLKGTLVGQHWSKRSPDVVPIELYG